MVVLSALLQNTNSASYCFYLIAKPYLRYFTLITSEVAAAHNILHNQGQ